ncbi:MAG: hypothetical protein ACHQ7N_08325 [Candidatus Methylomirabilales bacterium]
MRTKSKRADRTFKTQPPKRRRKPLACMLCGRRHFGECPRAVRIGL